MRSPTTLLLHRIDFASKRVCCLALMSLCASMLTAIGFCIPYPGLIWVSSRFYWSVCPLRLTPVRGLIHIGPGLRSTWILWISPHYFRHEWWPPSLMPGCFYLISKLSGQGLVSNDLILMDIPPWGDGGSSGVLAATTILSSGLFFYLTV